jgi:hypothetical protein
MNKEELGIGAKIWSIFKNYILASIFMAILVVIAMMYSEYEEPCVYKDDKVRVEEVARFYDGNDSIIIYSIDFNKNKYITTKIKKQ